MPIDLKRLRMLAKAARDIVLWEDAEYGDGEGFCQEWSYVFRFMLRLEGIRGEIIVGEVGGEEHFWVDVDGFTCDGTGDQFACPSIQVRKSRSSRRYVRQGKASKSDMQNLNGCNRAKELREMVRKWRKNVRAPQAHPDLVSSTSGLR